MSRIPSRLTEGLGDLYLIYAHVKAESLLFSGQELTKEKLDDLFRNRESQLLERPGFFRRLPKLIRINRNRRAVVASCVAMTAQYVKLSPGPQSIVSFAIIIIEADIVLASLSRQFSGIYIFTFLATSIFGESGIQGMRNLWFTFG